MKTYTKKEIAYLIQCSPRTIHDDIKYLGIKPIDNEDYGANIYSDRQFELIKSLREHCREQNKTRETFILPTPTEIVEQPLQKILPKPTTIYGKTKELIAQQLNIDPFYDLELLQRIVENGWLLPTTRLAAIIDVKPKTLIKKDRYLHCGYICTKIGQNRGSYLWRVDRSSI